MSEEIDKIININKDALFTLMQATEYFQKGGKFVIPAEYYEFLTTELKQIEEENKRLQAENEELKKENEELNRRMSDVIYRATGGRLCYSTYTLDAIEHAFQDQLEILSDRKTEELEQENEELKEAADSLLKIQYALAYSCTKYEQALEEIREIMQENCTQCFEIDNFTKSDDCGICEYARLLKVISEVLDERN